MNSTLQAGNNGESSIPLSSHRGTYGGELPAPLTSQDEGHKHALSPGASSMNSDDKVTVVSQATSTSRQCISQPLEKKQNMNIADARHRLSGDNLLNAAEPNLLKMHHSNSQVVTPSSLSDSMLQSGGSSAITEKLLSGKSSFASLDSSAKECSSKPLLSLSAGHPSKERMLPSAAAPVLKPHVAPALPKYPADSQPTIATAPRIRAPPLTAPTTGVSLPPLPVGPPSPPPPLKSLTMLHLRKKYTPELEYMLREFRKLERQLLGAKTNNAVEESAGSRERREKLHSFILHLEDTVRQIELGVQLELQGKSTVMVGVSLGGGASMDENSKTRNDGDVQMTEEEVKKQLATSAALTKLTKEKEEEENVQKLEEHILANLLPVKVRLTKQLAAQQGATKNPAGAPRTARGGLQPSDKGRPGTFVAAAEQRRKAQQEAARAAAYQMQQEQVATSSVGPMSPVSPGPAHPTHFGKPLRGGGSSLTKKLHGATLGSKARANGYGVGCSSPPTSSATAGAMPPDNVTSLPSAGDDSPSSSRTRKILYGGIAPGSTSRHVDSSLNTAVSVHGEAMIQGTLPEVDGDISYSAATNTYKIATAPVASNRIVVKGEAPDLTRAYKHIPAAPHTSASVTVPQKVNQHSIVQEQTHTVVTPKLEMDIDESRKRKAPDDLTLTPEELERLSRRKRRKRRKHKLAEKFKRQQQQQQALQRAAALEQAAAAATMRKKAASKNKKGNGFSNGPKSVEYICALCSETYPYTCDANPWWALSTHECPKCRKHQVPRIDITAPANTIAYHPALLAHADENNGRGANGSTPAVAPQIVPVVTAVPSAILSIMGSDSSDSDISDGDDDDFSLSDSESEYDSDDDLLSPAEQAESEGFGKAYSGPKLTENEAARLLILFDHASTCPGKHKDKAQRDVCRSTKFMMLHVRDCPGTTSLCDICPFPWCRKVKHLLYHLVSCPKPQTCPICAPKWVSKNLAHLAGLNLHRRNKQKQRIAALCTVVEPTRTSSAARHQPESVSSNENVKLAAVPLKGVPNIAPQSKAVHKANAMPIAAIAPPAQPKHVASMVYTAKPPAPKALTKVPIPTPVATQQKSVGGTPAIQAKALTKTAVPTTVPTQQKSPAMEGKGHIVIAHPVTVSRNKQGGFGSNTNTQVGSTVHDPIVYNQNIQPIVGTMDASDTKDDNIMKVKEETSTINTRLDSAASRTIVKIETKPEAAVKSVTALVQNPLIPFDIVQGSSTTVLSSSLETKPEGEGLVDRSDQVQSSSDIASNNIAVVKVENESTNVKDSGLIAHTFVSSEGKEEQEESLVVESTSAVSTAQHEVQQKEPLSVSALNPQSKEVKPGNSTDGLTQSPLLNTNQLMTVAKGLNNARGSNSSLTKLDQKAAKNNFNGIVSSKTDCGVISKKAGSRIDEDSAKKISA